MGYKARNDHREAMEAMESVFLSRAVASPVVRKNDPSKLLEIKRIWFRGCWDRIVEQIN